MTLIEASQIISIELLDLEGRRQTYNEIYTTAERLKAMQMAYSALALVSETQIQEFRAAQIWAAIG